MNWKKFYKEFYDLSGSYQYHHALELSSYGSNDEVVEVAKNFKMNNIQKTSAFMQNAVSSGVKFLPFQIIELKDFVDKDTLELIATKIVCPYSTEQLRLIKPYINRVAFHKISKITENDLPNMKYEIEIVKEEKLSLLASFGVAIIINKIINKLANNNEQNDNNLGY